MAKNICIFSDGTNQIGGIRPDQTLSNVYKMYRAMRPGPDSPISPMDQVAFYDPGLGTGEQRGIFGRLGQMLESAIGTGFEHNIIDCYEQIIAFYEPGDRILLFGFSRGAYTVRTLANVMNLCGVPMKMPDGTPVPRHGPELRKIASDAVKFVYSHGAGKPRGQAPYFANREELGRRFRAKYSSAPTDGPNVQGNVQPSFIGVYDTVASLETWRARILSGAGIVALLVMLVWAIKGDWHWVFVVIFAALLAQVAWYLKGLVIDSFKYFSPDPENPLRLKRLRDWPAIWRNGHFAGWRAAGVDRFLDPDVRHARHALAIDESRRDFPRVPWASRLDAVATADRKPEWLKQVWFAGCHADIGGSYPETQSRLSDISLDWMVEELRECVQNICLNETRLNRSPDPLGLQHREIYMLEIGPLKIRWPAKPRAIKPDIPLHPSVLVRLAAKTVPQDGEVKPYRPDQLRDHPQAAGYYANSAEPHTATM